MADGITVIHTEYDLRTALTCGQTFAFYQDGDALVGVADGRPVSVTEHGEGMLAGIADARPVSVAERGKGALAGIAGGRPVTVSKSGDGAIRGGFDIKCRDADAGFWRRYFDLDRQYGALLEPYLERGDDGDGVHGSGGSGGSSGSAADAGTPGGGAISDAGTPGGGGANYHTGGIFLARCVGAYGGLRLLRQPVWETICGFIISANNNVRRIETIYRRISEKFGESLDWDGRRFYAFPSAEVLADAGDEGLRSLGLGYRAPYIRETARAIADGGLPGYDDMEYGDALKSLTGLRGVGEKVADCVLLCATRHQEAFPVDVWIKRAMNVYYGMDGSNRALKREAQDLFGRAAGLAQLFLFHGIRSGAGARVNDE